LLPPGSTTADRPLFASYAGIVSSCSIATDA